MRCDVTARVAPCHRPAPAPPGMRRVPSVPGWHLSQLGKSQHEGCDCPSFQRGFGGCQRALVPSPRAQAVASAPRRPACPPFAQGIGSEGCARATAASCSLTFQGKWKKFWLFSKVKLLRRKQIFCPIKNPIFCQNSFH